MKKEIADIWVKALRSDDYKQVQGYLTKREGNTNSFCCLGVLCDIMQKQTKELKVETMYDHYKYNGHGSNLPVEVRKWSGMTSSDGGFTSNVDLEETLMTLNDTGKTFKEIADLIEKYYEQL